MSSRVTGLDATAPRPDLLKLDKWVIRVAAEPPIGLDGKPFSAVGVKSDRVVWVSPGLNPQDAAVAIGEVLAMVLKY